MSVALTPRLERIVQDKVASGRYGSPTQVLREALRLLDRQERQGEAASRRVRSQIDGGWESLLRGRTVDGEAFFDQLARRERALVQRKK
jgi:antitoxin ParD1/3/4